MYLKKISIKLILVCFCVTLLVTACEPSSNETSNTVKLDSNKIQAAINEIKAESKVKDLHYDDTAAVQWHVGVVDDGSKRFGYASYICGILAEHDVIVPSTSVRVVDVVKVTQSNESFRKASLGRVDCNTYESISP